MREGVEGAHPSDQVLAEMHAATMGLIWVTGTKDLHSAIDALGDLEF
jgi:hypothetical protein